MIDIDRPWDFGGKNMDSGMAGCFQSFYIGSSSGNINQQHHFCRSPSSHPQDQRRVLELDLRLAALFLPAAPDLGTQHLHAAADVGGHHQPDHATPSGSAAEVTNIRGFGDKLTWGYHWDWDIFWGFNYWEIWDKSGINSYMIWLNQRMFINVNHKCFHVNHWPSWYFPMKSPSIPWDFSTQAELWKSTASCRLWIRWTLSTMGRGGSAGQQIRDEILVIMHAHNIKDREKTTAKMTYQKNHDMCK